MNLSDHSERYTLTDEALVEMLRSDHSWALKEIFDRYHLRLYRRAAGVLRDDDLAKDLVQDVSDGHQPRRHHRYEDPSGHVTAFVTVRRGEVEMTPEECASGTDRVAEVAIATV